MKEIPLEVEVHCLIFFFPISTLFTDSSHPPLKIIIA